MNIKSLSTLQRFVLYGLLFFILVGMVTSLYFIMTTGSTSPNSTVTASIYVDGVLLEQINLTTITTPYTFIVTNKLGEENEIQVGQNEIGIISATCPDHICTHRGMVAYSQLPITCLPNNVIIVFEENATTSSDMMTY